MTSLGDSLPRITRIKLARDRLKPGAILRLYCSFTNPPKHKFIVLVATEPYPIQFLINSELTRFIQARQELLKVQVAIGPRTHDCFTRQCFIDCHEPSYLTMEEMENQVVDNMDCYKGRLPHDVVAQVMNAVDHAVTVEIQEKRWILEQLAPQEEDRPAA